MRKHALWLCCLFLLSLTAQAGNAQAASELAEIQDRAERGDAAAQYELGQIYRRGIVAAKDDDKAAQWYLKAAEQGHVDAQVNLALMCHHGRGVPKDEAKAVYWFHKAAEKGDPGAKAYLARKYGAAQNAPNKPVFSGDSHPPLPLTPPQGGTWSSGSILPQNPPKAPPPKK